MKLNELTNIGDIWIARCRNLFSYAQNADNDFFKRIKAIVLCSIMMARILKLVEMQHAKFQPPKGRFRIGGITYSSGGEFILNPKINN